MDTFLHSDTNLVAAALQHGRAWGLDWQMVKHRSERPQTPPRVQLRLGAQRVLYTVWVRRGLRPATLGAVVHQLARVASPALLVTDHVTPPLAEELRSRGIEFIDAAGNAYLNQPPLLVWVKGQRPVQVLDSFEPRGRAFQPTGLRVLFVLLCMPELVDRSYREIAALAGVAHGTVGGVMLELPRLGFVTEIKGKRRLINPQALLQQWVEAYARTLRPKLILGRYRSETLDWTQTLDATKYGLVLGGEPAAQILTGHLRPGTASLYGAKAEPRLLLDKRLRPDANGNVEILQRFWNFEGEKPGLAPMVLVYADLLAIGDARCLETAEFVRERIVSRFI